MKKISASTFVALIAALSLLSGCRFDVAASLGLRQAADLVRPGAKGAAAVDAVLKFEIGSEDDFKQKKDEYAAVMGGYFDGIRNVRFHKEELSSYFMCDAKVFLVPAGAAVPEGKKVILYFTVSPAANGFALGLCIDPKGLAGLNTVINEKYYQTIKIEDIKITLAVKNDLPAAIKLKAYSVYADGKPIPLSADLALGPGRECSVRISDILRDSIYLEGGKVFLDVDTVSPRAEGEGKK